MYRGERFNGFSHLAGAILAATGMAVLVTSSALHHDAWKVVSSVVYGTTLVLLYTISTLYHSLRGPAKSLFQRLDYCAIYLLIAGSYTPFALVTLRGLGLGAVRHQLGTGRHWHCAGTLDRPPHAPVLTADLRGDGLAGADCHGAAGHRAACTRPVVAGSRWRALYDGHRLFLFDEKVRHFHGIWHLFVLAGSACQFVSILLYVG